MKTVTLEVTVRCDEAVPEAQIERILNRGINGVCDSRGATTPRYITVDGYICEVDFIQWIHASR